MILISHRGNLNGPDPKTENCPTQILKVLEMGFDCEIDVWREEGKFYLGHDEPNYPVDQTFLSKSNLWIHAKNLEALTNMPTSVNFFWHETDSYTLTSKGYIWTFPNKATSEKSVIVDKSRNWGAKNYNCFGVCTDCILN